MNMPNTAEFLYPIAISRYAIEICLLIFTAWLVRRISLRWLRARGKTSQHQIFAVLDQAIIPLLLLGLLAAILNLFPVPAKLLAILNRAIYVVFLVVLLYYASRATQGALNRWLARTEGNESARDTSRFLVRWLFLIIGAMLVLDNLGISLTALWTTLGIGSVAVALALQDTLSNFFGGVYLQLDRPVRLDDYVKLGTGEEGFVVQIGWRSTRMRTLGNNIIVIPNASLAKAVITNYSLPEAHMSLTIPIAVSYSSDVEQVERVLLEEASRAAEEITGLQASPAPFVRFLPGFGDSALKFTLICRVNSYVDQYLVQHELHKRILGRFRSEGIEIPFNQYDVHLHTPPVPSLSNPGLTS
jgi:small-conductance mechanosensitive channel